VGLGSGPAAVDEAWGSRVGVIVRLCEGEGDLLRPGTKE
jgi:hypothetical protein